MNPEDYEKIARIFNQACDMPQHEQASHLDEACSDCPHLRSEVEAMLAQDAQAVSRDNSAAATTDPNAAVDAPTIEVSDASRRGGADPQRSKPEITGYALLEEIGRGGMGIVYRASQKQPSRTVALKMIRAGRFASDAEVQRFYAEAESAANLDHEGVIPIYEVGQHGNAHFFSMKCIEGRNLAQHLLDGDLTQRELLEILQAVCQAAAHCHAKGIVHRDLKPSNILVDRRRRPYITDFGLAKYRRHDSSLTCAGDIMGTPGYMPPEQASGLSESVGPEADVYALGAVLYHVLTGRPPIHAERVNLAGAIRLVQEHDIVPPRSIDRRIARDLDTICMKCLEKDPSRRYSDAGQLAADLERYLEGEPVQAKPLGRPRRIMRWARQQPGLATTWAALVLFYVYHLINYHAFREYSKTQPSLDATFYWVSTGVIASWAVGAWAAQRALLISSGRAVYLYLWATMDVFLLTIILFVGDGASSPLALLYHVLVAGAILRFRSDLVGYVTALSLLAYLWLIVAARLFSSHSPPSFFEIVPFVFSLIIIGLIQYLALRRSRSHLTPAPTSFAEPTRR